jgi:hypothetical protein
MAIDVLPVADPLVGYLIRSFDATDPVLRMWIKVTRVWNWHIADDVLVGSKVRYLSNFSAAPHFGERPQSARSCHASRPRSESPRAVRVAPKNQRRRGRRYWSFVQAVLTTSFQISFSSR